MLYLFCKFDILLYFDIFCIFSVGRIRSTSTSVPLWFPEPKSALGWRHMMILPRRAMTGHDYSLSLHCTVGHLRRVDGALPDFSDGEKAVNFFAPTPTPMYIFCIFCIFYIFDLFDILFVSRHTIRASQPVFGFWYYFMIHRAIGVSLQRILPKFLPRSDADVDELLSCKLRV